MYLLHMPMSVNSVLLMITATTDGELRPQRDLKRVKTSRLAAGQRLLQVKTSTFASGFKWEVGGPSMNVELGQLGLRRCEHEQTTLQMQC